MIEENKHAPCSSPTSGLTLDIRSAPGLLDQIPITPEYDSPHKVHGSLSFETLCRFHCLLSNFRV